VVKGGPKTSKWPARGGGRPPCSHQFRHWSHGGSKKMRPATFKRTTKKRILCPIFSRNNCKELFTFVSAMVKLNAG